MTRVAAVDIGTNSTRLLVADRDGTGRDAKLFPLDRRTQITRLGQGVDKERRLHGDAIDRTLTTLRQYREIIDSLGVERVRATATSA
jgi:exopolyphosphatase/guanosine-5'-triphosphate,3'-diphosphate pyrophosphatase